MAGKQRTKNLSTIRSCQKMKICLVFVLKSFSETDCWHWRKQGL